MRPSNPEALAFFVWAELRKLRALGVTKALTLWPEWDAMIAMLDKRVENRGWPPPAGTVGSRIALHAGAHVGGRKGKAARVEGLEAVIGMARIAGWVVDAVLERDDRPPIAWNAAKEISGAEVATMQRCLEGNPPPATRSVLTFTKGDRVVRLDTNRIVLSAIIGHARVARVINPERLPTDLTPLVREHPWYVVGEHGWVLDDVVVLDEPIPMQGSQGLWMLPNKETP